MRVAFPIIAVVASVCLFMSTISIERHAPVDCFMLRHEPSWPMADTIEVFEATKHQCGYKAAKRLSGRYAVRGWQATLSPAQLCHDWTPKESKAMIESFCETLSGDDLRYCRISVRSMHSTGGYYSDHHPCDLDLRWRWAKWPFVTF